LAFTSKYGPEHLFIPLLRKFCGKETGTEYPEMTWPNVINEWMGE
jgi:hypothetical protein